MPTKEAYLIVKAAVSSMVDGFEENPNTRKYKLQKKRLEKATMKNSGYALIPNMSTVGEFNSSSGDLKAGVYLQKHTRYEYLTINRRRIIDANGVFTRIGFAPEEREHFDPKKTTNSLIKGIKGIIELLEAVDQKQFKPAEIFIGITNMKMASISQRLGFKIADQCYDSNGKINKDMKKIIIIGNLNEIRKNIEEFRNPSKLQKLEKRNQRLQSSSDLMAV